LMRCLLHSLRTSAFLNMCRMLLTRDTSQSRKSWLNVTASLNIEYCIRGTIAQVREALVRRAGASQRCAAHHGLDTRDVPTCDVPVERASAVKHIVLPREGGVTAMTQQCHRQGAAMHSHACMPTGVQCRPLTMVVTRDVSQLDRSALNVALSLNSSAMLVIWLTSHEPISP
jgi:hypothetical protein